MPQITNIRKKTGQFLKVEYYTISYKSHNTKQFIIKIHCIIKTISESMSARRKKKQSDDDIHSLCESMIDYTFTLTKIATELEFIQTQKL